MSTMHAMIAPEGEPKLGLRLGEGGRGPAGPALSSLLRSGGCLVSGESISEWRIEAAADLDSGFYLYGPAFEGEGLDELVAPGGPAALEACSRAARALELAATRLALPRGLTSAALLLGKDGVLILPPEAASRAARARAHEGGEAAANLRSARAEGPEAEAAFLVAQAAYRAASGECAYRPLPRSGAGTALASGGFLPLAQLRPELDAELAAAVDAALAAPEAASLPRLRAALEAAARRGWERELPPAELAEAARRLEAAKARLGKRRRREAFFRERRGLVIGVAAALVVALAAALTVVDVKRSKPDYSRLGPLEVARTYYRAVDSFDLDSMEACAPGGGKELKAVAEDTNYVSTMTVVSKMRQAYEGKDPIVKAQAWVDAGKPPIEADRALYGIAGLAIAELSSAPDRAAYRAEYSYWSLERPGGEAAAAAEARGEPLPGLPVERRLADELVLARDPKKGWRIVGISRSER